MGYARQPSPHVVEAARSGQVVTFIGEREMDAVLRCADPFGIDDVCEFNPIGKHYGIGSCGDVVCCYCGRIFWR
jgi:hypothetical protein